VQAFEQTEPEPVEWSHGPFRSRLTEAIEWLRLELGSLVGPSGWRSLIGPLLFVVGGSALLVYDHVNQRVTDVVFWLTLGLIVTVFGRMLETNRRQRLELEELDHEAFNDRVTGLANRRTLKIDIEAIAAAPGSTRVLVLLELDGIQAYGDRFGYQEADALLSHIALGLHGAVTPLGGTAYRFDANRLAALVPSGGQQLGEIVLAATAPLRGDGEDIPIGRAYGEVAIPSDAADPETAFQIAGQRLAMHKQRQHRSARRQAHAVLMAALSARRPELRDHLRVVAYRAISLSRRLGLGSEQIDDIALAAELQDIGLLTVPEAVLEKATPFDQAETALIHRHPLEGERIISAAPGLAPVAGLVRSSYERFDGSGYPDGISGTAIPFGARIIAVAVAFAALTSNRPYRAAISAEEALAELRRCAGTQFDPQVVETLAAELAEEALPAISRASTPV
jgi:HD-GYP domain-containing protein (c-di-GMP phosphodiesterase class II)